MPKAWSFECCAGVSSEFTAIREATAEDEKAVGTEVRALPLEDP